MSVSRNLDKFYTKPLVVERCLSLLPLAQYDCVVEPSAGDGAWSCHFPECIAIDIHPDHPSIRQGDFLKLNLETELVGKKVLVVGNPPFGRQCSLAIRFFNKSASYPEVQTIAMIFPKSFRKVSIQKRLDLNFHLERETDVSDTFLLDGKDYDVPCVFHVWQRQNKQRVVPEMPKLSCPYVTFTTIKKIRGGDILVAVRRVGFYAGRSYPYNGQNQQTHYFLVVKEVRPEEVINYLNSVEWSHNDTTGPRSISKRQLIPILNRFTEKIELRL